MHRARQSRHQESHSSTAAPSPLCQHSQTSPSSLSCFWSRNESADLRDGKADGNRQILVHGTTSRLTVACRQVSQVAVEQTQASRLYAHRGGFSDLFSSAASGLHFNKMSVRKEANAKCLRPDS